MRRLINILLIMFAVFTVACGGGINLEGLNDHDPWEQRVTGYYHTDSVHGDKPYSVSNATVNVHMYKLQPKTETYAAKGSIIINGNYNMPAVAMLYFDEDNLPLPDKEKNQAVIRGTLRVVEGQPTDADYSHYWYKSFELTIDEERIGLMLYFETDSGIQPLYMIME